MQISHTHFLNHNSQKIRKQPLEGVRKKMCCGFCSKKIAKYPEGVQFLVKLQAVVPQLY